MQMILISLTLSHTINQYLTMIKRGPSPLRMTIIIFGQKVFLLIKTRKKSSKRIYVWNITKWNSKVR